MIKSRTAGFIISVCLTFSFTPAKSQVLPKNFYEAKKYARQIYAAYPYSFYCGCRYFTQGKKLVPYLKSCGYQARIPFMKNGMVNNRITRIEWEHIMPAWVFGHHLKCWQKGGRKNCRKKSPLFRMMEADLHNLVPAIGEINQDRSYYRFGYLQGEKRAYGACDFEVDFKSRKVEPAEVIRGDIARIYFYMSQYYKINLSPSLQKILKVWDKQDPVSRFEIYKNQAIGKLTGRKNPYIKP